LLVDGRDVSRVRVADTYAARLRGLLGTDPSAEPLLLTPASSVHGWGMRYALDVAQLSGELGAGLAVVRVVVLRRGGMVAPRRGVRHVLEAPRGAFASWELVAGSRVAVTPA
jgi:uncharacterized membrane protein (UPF0127 family)